MAWSTAQASVTSSSAPPTMMASVPSKAPSSPPLTGASISFTAPPDARDALAASSRIPSGDTVEPTTTTVLPRTGNDPVGAGHHVGHVGEVRNHDDHNVTGFGHHLCAGLPYRPGGDEILSPRRATGEDMDLGVGRCGGSEQVASHRLSHYAKANEPNTLRKHSGGNASACSHFSAPAVMPSMNLRLKITYIRTTGSTAMTTDANTRPYAVE
jgi:hypothetical protein